MKRDAKYWALCLFHNWVAHPFLPLADLLDELGEKKVSQFIYDVHDCSFPDGGG